MSKKYIYVSNRNVMKFAGYGPKTFLKFYTVYFFYVNF